MHFILLIQTLNSNFSNSKMLAEKPEFAKKKLFIYSNIQLCKYIFFSFIQLL